MNTLKKEIYWIFFLVKCVYIVDTLSGKVLKHADGLFQPKTPTTNFMHLNWFLPVATLFSTSFYSFS